MAPDASEGLHPRQLPAVADAKRQRAPAPLSNAMPHHLLLTIAILGWAVALGGLVYAQLFVSALPAPKAVMSAQTFTGVLAIGVGCWSALLRSWARCSFSCSRLSHQARFIWLPQSAEPMSSQASHCSSMRRTSAMLRHPRHPGTSMGTPYLVTGLLSACLLTGCATSEPRFDTPPIVFARAAYEQCASDALDRVKVAEPALSVHGKVVRAVAACQPRLDALREVAIADNVGSSTARLAAIRYPSEVLEKTMTSLAASLAQ